MQRILISFSMVLMTFASASASEIVHTFRSPSFGGNPLNGSYLQYTADANNQHTEEDSFSTEDSISDLVRRSVSFQIANNINSAMFGDDALASGTSFLGDGSSVSWSRSGSLVTVTFTGIDGTVTTFVVPDP